MDRHVLAAANVEKIYLAIIRHDVDLFWKRIEAP
jgi:hypothetical protein